MSVETTPTFRTDDMALVTYLRMCGHSIQEVFWDSSVCYWRFFTSESLLTEKENFVTGEARVDPKEFTKHYATTKTELYNSNPNPRSR